MFALAHARPEMDNGANLPPDLHPLMTTKEVPCDSTEKDCSDDWGVPRSKKQDDLIILGDGIAQRMEGNVDEKSKLYCKPGWIHCAPGVGGGCCHPSVPVCCFNGSGCECRKYRPCSVSNSGPLKRPKSFYPCYS